MVRPEQVEEEATVQDILDKLELVGDDGPARMMMDQELGQRGGVSGGDGGSGESAPGESPAE